MRSKIDSSGTDRLDTVRSISPSARLAVLVAQPMQFAPYTIRVKVHRGVKLMPHKHPEDRVYTATSGVFYIGLGDEFDEGKLEAYPPGTVIILPGNTSHFSLGQIRRVRHSDVSYWSTWPRVRAIERRNQSSASQS